MTYLEQLAEVRDAFSRLWRAVREALVFGDEDEDSDWGPPEDASVIQVFGDEEGGR